MGHASSAEAPTRRVAKIPGLFRKQGARKTYERWSALHDFRFLFFFIFFFENTLAGNCNEFSRNDLQSSTPEEYLDGRVLPDEAGLGNGSLAVEGDGGFPTESGVDYRRDFLLLLQRLLLISASHQSDICLTAVIFDVDLYTSNTGQKIEKEKKERACPYAARGATSNIHVRHACHSQNIIKYTS